MSDISRGSTYCGHPEYDTLQARHVARYERIGMTNDGWKVRQTVTVMDFGKPDRTPADPDAMIGTAEPGFERKTHTMQARTVDLLARVAEALQDGPLTALEIATALGESVPRIAALLRYHGEEFTVVERGNANRYAMRGED